MGKTPAPKMFQMPGGFGSAQGANVVTQSQTPAGGVTAGTVAGKPYVPPPPTPAAPTLPTPTPVEPRRRPVWGGEDSPIQARRFYGKGNRPMLDESLNWQDAFFG